VKTGHQVGDVGSFPSAPEGFAGLHLRIEHSRPPGRDRDQQCRERSHGRSHHRLRHGTIRPFWKPAERMSPSVISKCASPPPAVTTRSVRLPDGPPCTRRARGSRSAPSSGRSTGRQSSRPVIARHRLIRSMRFGACAVTMLATKGGCTFGVRVRFGLRAVTMRGLSMVMAADCAGTGYAPQLTGRRAGRGVLNRRRFPRFQRRDSMMQGARPSHQCGDSR
jgi:hypothetical protein